MRLYQVYVVFLLMRAVDDVNLLQKCFQSKGASRCMIIKLDNLHVKAQYLYKMNWGKEQVGVRSEGTYVVHGPSGLMETCCQGIPIV